ncbi:hypothetical protein AKJ40_02365 [candidate division MSBL1 archaeon SCGC-AAA259M10]|uniref:Uncharacterized protein n=1 Tax=candidate division MSBL1 archaeon SCGC-AAA259M10 TaxID=1698270 RepID=A0A133V040_9EURY|nr:hypothetical protein AKJ40_02365 [candidate division MSBL1 archaeon SCGC-AAA259M10]
MIGMKEFSNSKAQVVSGRLLYQTTEASNFHHPNASLRSAPQNYHHQTKNYQEDKEITVDRWGGFTNGLRRRLKISKAPLHSLDIRRAFPSRSIASG